MFVIQAKRCGFLRPQVLLLLFVANCAGLQAAPQIDSSDSAPSPSRATTAAKFKIDRYVNRLLLRYDADGNGRLSDDEWSKMRGEPARIDTDDDRVIVREELTAHIIRYAADRHLGPLPNPTRLADSESTQRTEPTSRLQPTSRFHVPEKARMTGLPGWFLQRDSNGDGQVSLSEYAPAAEASAVVQFQRLDANSDGLITGAELVNQEVAAEEIGTPAE